jgi:metallo-beta-lactamase superfamily protein
MTSRFTALPLAGGEAFLLETGHARSTWTILVDAGLHSRLPRHPLVALIRSAAQQVNRIDIAVCTHQDADHAKGFVTFPEAWYASGGSIGEFWLPGRWAAALPAALVNPQRLVSQLVQGALEAERIHENLNRTYGEELVQIPLILELAARPPNILRDLADAYRSAAIETEERPNEQVDDVDERTARSLGIDVELAEFVRHAFKASDLTAAKVFDELISHLRRLPLEAVAVRTQLSIALDVAKLIVSIAQAALRFKIPIRWFDFGLYEGGRKPAGGRRSLLVPLCAVELRMPPKPVSPLLLFFSLTLSRQNVESLAFSRPETVDEPAVLFVGDSRLSFGLARPSKDFSMPPTVPKRRIIATAAHHGSCVNDNAYHVIERWLGVGSQEPIYLRNGGIVSQTLGSFCNKRDRRCAQCIQCHGPRWRQPVALITQGNLWVWPPAEARPCGTPRF